MSTNESAETVSAETAAGRLREIARSIESRLDEASVDALVRGPLSTRNAREANEHRMPPGALIHMALLNDALCVAETAIMEDRVITASEAEYIAPLVREVIPYLGRLRGFYEGFGIAADEVKQLLETHSQDRQPFGGKCEETRWAGVDLCLRFAEQSSDASPLRDYTDVMARMIDDIFDLSPGASVSARDTLRSVLARRAGLGESRALDPREAAFCRASGAEVFHAVAHAQDVFSPDPLDVVEIHEEARDSFGRIVTRVASSPSHGRMLLIKGESGSGKTHLMRAFRTHVHRERSGYVAYMQMSTQASNYARYVLSNVVDSLDRPFLPNEPSALSCIADAMLRGSAPPRLAERLRSEDISAEDHAMVVGNVADYVVATPGMETIDVDLVRAFAYLVSESPAIRARALRYLRCDDLTDYDRRLLGGMSPMLDEAAPMRMLTGIGKLAFAANRSALVFLLDQLEDLFHLDGAAARFRALVNALRQITDHVPTSVVVVACLDDYYEELRPALPRPLLNRLERDPEPVRLLSARTTVDVELLVSRRLRHLFESQDVTFREDEPLWPFPREKVHALATLRTRDVLDWCRSEHGRCIGAGRIVAAARPTTVRPPPPPPPRLATEWMEFQSKQAAPPTDDGELARLLQWSVVQAARELELRVDVEDGFPLALRFGGGSKPAILGLCNRDARGGGLAGQVDEVRKRAEALAATVILARSSEFPAPGKTKIAEKLGEVVKRGGRKVLVSDGDWRQLQALKDFLAGRPATPDLEAWLRAERPAARIAALSAVFDGVNIAASAPASRPAPTGTAVAKVDPETRPQAPSPPAPPKPNGALAVGRTRSLVPADVTLETADLARHAAFLGSTGSGKTTLALAILEQCLARGIPALLVNRKGDLSTYGSPSFWDAPEPDEERARRKRELRASVNVHVFTPGDGRGRSLALRVIPSGLGNVAAQERAMIAESAAASLGAMMNYKRSQQDDARLVILARSIEIVGPLRGDGDVSLEDIISLIDEEDAALVDAVGRLDRKHFRALVEHLTTLQLRHQALLKADGELLSPELLFGLGGAQSPGRTRLSVICTKFFSDPTVVNFWVSRLLVELARWASKNPSSTLQALVLLDEADIYLPAQSKPATKQPMQELLRRARSAGMGVMLATQSPGDFDYKCRDNIRTWMVGRVAEKTAIDKMKPLLAEFRGNPSAKLAAARIGEFFLLAEGDVTEIRAHRSLMNTKQLSEDEILRVAHATRSGGG